MSDNRAHLEARMKDLVAGLGLDVEPEPESFWWTSTCAEETKTDMNLVAVDMIFFFSVAGERSPAGK